jgi:predicted permease
MLFWLKRLGLRWRATLSRTDRDLRDEHEFHLALLEQEHLAEGLSIEEARQRSHREFGNTTRLLETSHDVFAFRVVEDLGSDVRCAIRQMRRSTGFTRIAVLSLAVGIGAVTSVFAVLDAFVLRRLAVHAPDRLVAFSTTTNPGWQWWTYAQYSFWQIAPNRLVDVAAVYAFPEMTESRGEGASAPVRVSLVSDNYFDVMGVAAARGRVFTAADDDLLAPQSVVVISDAFWVRRFGGAADVVGRTIELDRRTYEIVGVTSPGFAGEWVGQPTDIWAPLSLHRQLAPDAPPAMFDPWNIENAWLRVIGRLRDGVTRQAAEATAQRHYQQFLKGKAAFVGGDAPPLAHARTLQIALLGAATGYAPARQAYAQPLILLTGLVTLVMLVACFNFTSLLLARTHARGREFAVRLTLGAGRLRLVRQSFTEGAVLALLAGGFGLLLARWAAALSLNYFSANIGPFAVDLRIDARVLGFTSACVLTVMMFSLVAAIWGSRVRLTPAAISARHGGITRWRQGVAGNRLMLVSQLALCTMLLLAGLLLRTTLNLRNQDLGWDRNVLLVSVAPAQAGYSSRAGATLLRDIARQLEALHGIESVGASGTLVLDRTNYWVDTSERLSTDAAPPMRGVRWTFSSISPDFFATMGVPMVRGREFSETDGPSHNVVVINQSLARLLYGDADPIGRRVGLTPKAANLQVIGVVNDAKQVSPRDRGLGVMYLPLRETARVATLAVRTSGDPSEAADMIEHHVRSFDKDLRLLRISTVDAVFDDAIAQERLMGAIATVLAILVVLIVSGGLHAAMSYDVARREHEMGVRLALGASRHDVMALVLRESSRLAFAGLAVGVPLGLSVSQPLRGQLFGVTVNDPQTIVSVTLLLVAVATLATLWPARNASQADPVALLRAE